MRRPPVWIAADATVGDAARLMRAEGISSVLVRGRAPGHRHRPRLREPRARRRARPGDAARAGRLAPAPDAPRRDPDARGLDEPARDGRPPRAGHARGGEVVGVVTANDLLKASAQGPMAVLRQVERLAVAREPPRVRREGRRDGRGPARGRPRRDRHRAARRRGSTTRCSRGSSRGRRRTSAPPRRPGRGSRSARRAGASRRSSPTRTTRSSTPTSGEERRGWFQAFAERVNADMEAAGFPPVQRGPHGAPLQRARSPSGRASFNACIDERAPPRGRAPVRLPQGGRRARPRAARGGDGARAAEPARSSGSSRAPRSSTSRPRPSACGSAGPPQADLKAQGIVPVVFLARCYGLEVGARARGDPRPARGGGAGGAPLPGGARERRAGVPVPARAAAPAPAPAARGGAPADRRSSGSPTSPRSSGAGSRSRSARSSAGRTRAAYHYRTDFF